MVKEWREGSGLFCKGCNGEFFVGDHVYTEYPEGKPKETYHPDCRETKLKRLI